MHKNSTNKNRIKIVFVLPNLSSGGAERIMSFVADNISKEHFKASMLIAGHAEQTVYDINSVDIKYFNKSRILSAIPGFFFAMLKVQPDIVISSISHVNTAMAYISIFFPKTKFIGREANVLSVLKNHKEKSGKIGSKFSISSSYEKLDLVLCQSHDMYEDMKNNFNIPAHKLRVINNPMTDGFNLKSENQENSGKIQFITVARLKAQKGHERIINALSKIKFPFHYTIVGDGPEKEKLLKLIKKHKLEDKITHIPYTKEVSEYLSKSDFFLQGSYVEGFPNCLIESCSVGTPVLAYKAPGGLNEIIEEGKNGLVAENDEEFVKNINKAIQDFQWDKTQVRNVVHEKFNKEKILKEYEELFMGLVKDDQKS